MSDPANEYDRWVLPMEARLKRAVWRIVRDPEEIQDAFQQGLEKVWRQWEKVRGHPDPQALIFTIVVNVAYDLVRKRARHADFEMNDLDPERHASPAPGADSRLYGEEIQTAIHVAISELPEQQRLAITLRLLGELPYDVIAKTLGCAEATVRTHTMRALQNLRTKLAPLHPTAREGVKR